ncbi:MAG: 3-hydroxyacyl-ACP dehydratase FabZ family protein [Algisphaera sp.]
MRFYLIDRVLEQDDTRIVATKAVTSAEEYLDDHFPGFPVLPGVMMLETLVQAARTLIRKVDGPQSPGPLVLAQARNVRYAAMVRPGQTLQVEVTLRKRNDDGTLDFQGTGTVDSEVAVQARFSLSPVQNPS